MRSIPNLVIAGTVKGGTTSLFSYLSMHSDICPSKVKETCYFLPLRYNGELEPWDKYLHMFDEHCGQPYVMEATPGYFEGGTKLAKGLYSQLGDNVKIIITLRNPAERLASFFKYKKAQLQLPKEMDIKSYISACEAMPVEEKILQSNDALWGIEGGRYMQYLPQWYDVFPDENIKIVFFDDLKHNPMSVMYDICKWLGISQDIYETARFTTENQTVQYKHAHLQKLAIFINKRMEKVLWRFPKLKQWIRKIYYSLNGKSDEGLSKQEITEINKLYQAEIPALRLFLKNKGYSHLPPWLE